MALMPMESSMNMKLMLSGAALGVLLGSAAFAQRDPVQPDGVPGGHPACGASPKLGGDRRRRDRQLKLAATEVPGPPIRSSRRPRAPDRPIRSSRRPRARGRPTRNSRKPRAPGRPTEAHGNRGRRGGQPENSRKPRAPGRPIRSSRKPRAPGQRIRSSRKPRAPGRRTPSSRKPRAPGRPIRSSHSSWSAFLGYGRQAVERRGAHAGRHLLQPGAVRYPA